MKRALLRSNAFVRAAKRYVKRRPGAAEDLRATLSLMAEDVFDPRLKTHKLTGDLAGSWACSAGYDLRVIFSFVQHDGDDVILLETFGTHDEVY